MLEIDSLREPHLDGSLRLSVQAGWNQVRADWRRFLDHSPEGCFGGWVDDDLVATTCIATYDGSTSWIGMVLVDQDHRRQGYGSTIFEHGLAYALEHGGSAIGLDATTMGAPLYRRQGFEAVIDIERWAGRLQPVETAHDASILGTARWDDLFDLDAEAVDVDRSALLSRMLDEVGVTALGVEGSDGLDAYAVLRPGYNHPQLGPVVAPDDAHLSALLNEVETVLNEPTIIADAFPRGGTTATLEQHGLERQRELLRMAHESTDPLLYGESVRAATGFAWG